MFKNRDALYVSLFLVLILLLWTGFSLLPGPAALKLPLAEGGYDLAGLDFEDTVYITAPSWESWPEKLYAPEDLSAAEAPVPHQSLDYTKTQYATHRLRLTLPPGGVYGVSLYSAEYSMRLYIDGVERDSAGVPGTTRRETIPQMRQAVCYFQPQGETVEIVVQAANFVHREGSKAPTLTIGRADNIARLERNADLKIGLIFGCLITACLYHLAVFLMNRRQVSSLVFSALCLLLAIASRDFPALLLPSYNWQIAIRVEYVGYVLAADALALLVRLLFPGALHMRVFQGYIALSGAFIALVLFTDSAMFTRLLIGFQIMSVAMIGYSITRLALTHREGRSKKILALLGIYLFALFIVMDILSRYDVPVLSFLGRQGFTSATGMALFVFCYAMVLSIERAEINHRLEEAQTAIAGAEARYREMLEKKENGQTPPARVFDFSLTRRETEVALLLLDGKGRAEIAEILHISLGTVNTHCTNIYRKTGASGAAELARLMLPGNAPE